MHSGLKIPRKHLEISTKSNEMDYSFSAVYEAAKGLEQDFISLINVLK